MVFSTYLKDTEIAREMKGPTNTELSTKNYADSLAAISIIALTQPLLITSLTNISVTNPLI
jgi:hypothetical protein